MCGHFTQTKSRREALEALSDTQLPPLFHGRYNIAPTQEVMNNDHCCLAPADEQNDLSLFPKQE